MVAETIGNNFKFLILNFKSILNFQIIKNLKFIHLDFI